VSAQATLLFLLLFQVPLLPLGGLCGLALLFACNRLLVDQRQVIDIPHLVTQCVALFWYSSVILLSFGAAAWYSRSTRACAKLAQHKAMPANTIIFIDKLLTNPCSHL
jgi:hypothetical protein